MTAMPTADAARAKFFERRYDDMRNRVERALDLLDDFPVELQNQAVIGDLRSILYGGAE